MRDAALGENPSGESILFIAHSEIKKKKKGYFSCLWAAEWRGQNTRVQENEKVDVEGFEPSTSRMQSVRATTVPNAP